MIYVDEVLRGDLIEEEVDVVVGDALIHVTEEQLELAVSNVGFRLAEELENKRF